MGLLCHAVADTSAERLVTALTQQLYCVPDGSGRSIRDTYTAGDKVVEAAITIYKQQQVR
jgi:hypothetical protein